jgi:hypothetical protein
MAKGRGWLQITINLSAFEEGNKTMNAMEVMDIFWKIMDQQKEPKASGRVPEDVESRVKAYWHLKPHLSPFDLNEKVEYNVYEDKEGHSCDTTDEKS